MATHHAELLEARRLHNKNVVGAFEAYRLWLLTWFSCVGCCLHDIHNSLKWAMLQLFECTVVLRNVFIMIESLRNSYDELNAHLPGWLERHLLFEDDSPNIDRSGVWTLCGISPDIVELMIKLQVRFDGDALKVAVAYRDDHTVHEQLKVILLHVWRWERFTDARWALVGWSCRIMLAGFLLGLDSLACEIIATPGAHTYYLKGWKFKTPEVLHFIVVCAVSSFVSDSALALLMEDDRLPVVLKAVEDELHTELEYIQNISDVTFDIIGEAVGFAGGILRSEINAAAWTQAAFIAERLRPAKEEPWSTFAMEAESALDAIIGGEKPKNSELFKIWELNRIGHPRADLIVGIRLRRMAGWSSKTVEQGHVCVPVLLRKHPHYTQETLGGRAMVVGAAPLFKMPVNERRIVQLERRMVALDRRCPSHINGRHMFVKDLNAKSADMKLQGRVVPEDMHKQIMVAHGPLWKAMAPATRDGYRAEAESTRNIAHDELVNKRLDIAAQIDILKARSQADGDVWSQPLSMSSCSLTRSQIIDFDAFAMSAEWSEAKVAALRVDAMVPRRPPPLGHIRILESMAIEVPTDGHPRPHWLSFVCQHREFFYNCVFKFNSVASAVYYRFCYASQRPYLAAFMNIELHASPPNIIIEPRDRSASEADIWEHNFAVGETSFIFSDEANIDQEAFVYVLTDCFFHRDGVVVSDSIWLTLDEVRIMLPTVAGAPAEEPVAEEAHPKCDAKDYDDMPWLLDLAGPTALGFVPGGVPAPPGFGSDDGNDPDDDLDKIMNVGDVFDELMARRAILLADAPVASNFYVTARGGLWTAARHGVAYDCFGAYARGGPATDWCTQFGLNKSASFSIHRYGEEGAELLAKAWVHKFEWLYAVCGDSVPGDNVYPQEVRDAYGEPLPLTLFWAVASIDFRTRVDWLRAQWPRAIM